MTGLRDPFAPGRQPAGREPAPGRLALVQAYANSFWDLDAGGADAWADDDAWRAWAAARGFARPGDRAAALAVREALRALAYANHDGRAPGAALTVLDRYAAPVLPRLHAGGLRHDSDDPTALTIAVVGEALADGSWSRLKACPGPHCGWTYWDSSRNRSSQWCSMAICGNRVKGRTFRARRKVENLNH